MSSFENLRVTFDYGKIVLLAKNAQMSVPKAMKRFKKKFEQIEDSTDVVDHKSMHFV